MKSNFKILLVEDMDSFRNAVSQMLGVYNDLDEATDLATARRLLQKTRYDVVILDKGLPDGDGIDLIAEIKSSTPNAVVIVLTSDSDFSSVKHCIAKGADDYVIKSANVVPDLLVRIPVAISKAASHRRLESLEQQVKSAFRYEMVGKSEATMQLREQILGLKGSSANVLITGESGTGKELIARRLNAIEDNEERPFVVINCGAIPENLVESELFGHKRGSFTGATEDRPGKFELADNGDIFLDEIGEIPLHAQVKLLRVIQDGEFSRVGDSRTIKVKCRVIAATNQYIEEMVSSGKFREDLYHRLNVIRLSTQPLRSRTADIPDLAKLFTLQIGGTNFKITDRAIKPLQEYDWPGNVREFRNAIERAVISARRRKSTELIFEDVMVKPATNNNGYKARKIEATFPTKLADLTPDSYREFMELVEREYFAAALQAADENIEALAERIGISRATAFRRLKSMMPEASKQSTSKSKFLRSKNKEDGERRIM